MLTTILLFCLLGLSQGSHNLSSSYRYSMQLSPNYALHWNFDRATENISFAVRVRTTGWVGFGISPNGQMPQSDVVIGWVDGSGTAHFNDRFAEARAMPPIDEVQNWNLIRGEEDDGFTTLEFWRKFISCDDRDRDIIPETIRIIWSYNDADPVNENSVTFHQSGQGSASANLLGRLQNGRTIPPDTDSFIIRPTTNVNVPDGDTTYWCTYLDLAMFGITSAEELYIYRVAPFITSGNTKLVHHMLLYVCPSGTNIETPGNCDDLPTQVVGCRGGQIFGSWAIGGDDFIYPEGVALPIGGPNGHSIVLLEVHYDNPDMKNDFVDRSGMEFFYSRQMPTHLAGGISLGYPVLPDLVVPPGADNFVVQAICSAECLERFLPDEGITVFGSFLHSHLAGRGFTVSHARSVVGSTCNATEELPHIDQNLNYDFNFQQSVILPRPIQIRKGDSIIMDCLYRSQGRTKITIGGQSTREEMCEDFLFYYPRIPLTACQSIPEPFSAYEQFLMRYLNGDRSRVDSTLWAFYAGQANSIAATFNSITWTPDTIRGFQDSLLNNSKYIEFCYGGLTHDYLEGISEQDRPNITCPYVAPDQCNPTPSSSCTCPGPSVGHRPSPSVVSGPSVGQVVGIAVGTVIGVVVLLAAILIATLIIVYVLKYRYNKVKHLERTKDAELMKNEL